MAPAPSASVTADDLALRPFSASLPMALLRAREAAMARFRPHLAEHGLTEQQWRVLRALASLDGPLDVGDLVRHTALLAPSLSRILARLERLGLTDRRPVPRDQRRNHITLTPEGWELVRRIAPGSEARYNDIEARFGAERLARLLGELEELTAALADDPDDESPDDESPVTP